MLIVNFLRGLFDANGNVSSKRVSGIVVILCCCFIFIYGHMAKISVDHHMFDALLIFVITCFGMNTVITQKSMDVKKDVASDMVDSDKPKANEDAKDVLNSPKP